MSIAARLALAVAIASLLVGCVSTPGPELADAGPGGVAPGRFLIANPQVTGPFFGRSVVLILDYSAAGALGLIVNRPLTLELRALLPGVEALRDREDVVYMGGPVARGRMTLLIRSAESLPEAMPVVGDVAVSGSPAVLRELIERKPTGAQFRTYIGHAGWTAGQLEAEIERGDWVVSPAEPDLIFSNDEASLWPSLIRDLEGREVRAPDGGVASRELRWHY